MMKLGEYCKISSYLVRAKLYPLDRVVGSTNCGKKRCEICVKQINLLAILLAKHIK